MTTFKIDRFRNKAFLSRIRILSVMLDAVRNIEGIIPFTENLDKVVDSIPRSAAIDSHFVGNLDIALTGS